MRIKQSAVRNGYKYTYENFTTINRHGDGISCVSIMHIPLKVFLDVCGSFFDQFASLDVLMSPPD